MHIGILLAGIEKRVIGIDLQGHMAISTQNIKKQRSTSLLFTDLGRPRGPR